MTLKKPQLKAVAADFAVEKAVSGRQAPAGQTRLNINIDVQKLIDLKVIAAKRQTTITAMLTEKIDEILRQG